MVVWLLASGLVTGITHVNRPTGYRPSNAVKSARRVKSQRPDIIRMPGQEHGVRMTSQLRTRRPSADDVMRRNSGRSLKALHKVRKEF